MPLDVFPSAPLVADSSDRDLPSYQHPERQAFKQILDLLMDVWDGLEGTKQHYLPQEQEEPNSAYFQRLDRSYFDNRFKPAIAALAALIADFDLDESEIPQTFIANRQNVDLLGGDAIAFFKQAVEKALRDHAVAIHVEMPPQDPTIQSEAARIASGRRPYFVMIDIRDIINWRVSYINGAAFIEHVTIVERSLEPDGQYGVKTVTRYRVLTPGLFELFEIDESDKGEKIARLVKSGQTSLDQVPLVWFSATGSKPMEFGIPPFLNLARLNIKHFQKQSEKDEVMRKCNLPVPVMEHPGALPDQLPSTTIGPNSVIHCPGGGSFKFAEPTGVAIAATQADIEKLEIAMDRVTLAFLHGGEIQRTATEAKLDSSQTQATLKGMIQAQVSAMQQLLRLWVAYTGESYDGGGVQANENILRSPIGADFVRVLLEMVYGGVLPQDALLEVLKRSDVLPPDFAVDEAIATTRPTLNPDAVLAR